MKEYNVFQKQLGVSLLACTAAVVLVFATQVYGQPNVTPAQYLASQPKPNFAAGNHLPKLSDWDYQSFSTNTCVEMAKDWGYCLPFDFENGTVAGITNATGTLYCSLANSNPSLYKLDVHINFARLNPFPNGLFCTNSAGLFVDNSSNTWSGYPYTNSHSAIFSPAPPDSYLAAWASNSMWSISVLKSNCPNIAIVLDDGEWGMGAFDGNANAWRLDPRWIRATNGISWPGGIIIRYASMQKGHQLGFWTAAIKTLLPNRQLSLFYETDGERNRTITSLTGPGSIWTGQYYSFNSDIINSNSDLPSFQEYWNGTNWSGACFIQAPGYDLLTTHLNQVGFNFKNGFTNDYSSVSGGWQFSTNMNYAALSDIPTYTGFLKCLYTAGSVGAAEGYFYDPDANPPSEYGTVFGTGWDAAFPTNVPPNWLLQIMALSHVHALFTHLENVLTNGDLLSGPQSHRYSLDQPAYEFTNTAGYVNDRVLVRKLRGQNQWLVTAWAADGTNRNVTVTIPTIGNLTVTAIPSASVYQVTMSGTNVQKTLLDEYASFPKTLAPPTSLQVLPK
jgi:hypothetical protein